MTKRKHKVIVGLGRTGYSCARYFRRKGIAFSVMDDASRPPFLEALHREMPDVPFCRISSPELLKADEIVLSPGVPLQHEEIRVAKEAGINITGDIAIFANEVKQPVVMITGSNGKSTVTRLVAAMAEADGLDVGVGGNIGIPCLDVLEQKHELYILETSSYQLEVVDSLNASVAVVLNLSPDHLDRYDNLQAYYSTKARIYRGCRSAIYNRQTEFDFEIPADAIRLSFGLDAPAASTSFGIRTKGTISFLSQGREDLIDTASLSLKGKHNWLNCLAAMAIGDAIGLHREAMLRTLTVYPGLPHRCEWLGQFGGVSFYNDSKSTNPGSMRAAVEGFSTGTKNIVLIMGGQSKGADFSDLGMLCEKELKRCFLYGQDRNEIAAAIGIDGTICTTLADVVGCLAAEIKPGDIVLFSPACASFDQFENYEHRGDEFKRLIQGTFA